MQFLHINTHTYVHIIGIHKFHVLYVLFVDCYIMCMYYTCCTYTMILYTVCMVLLHMCIVYILYCMYGTICRVLKCILNTYCMYCLQGVTMCTKYILCVLFAGC